MTEDTKDAVSIFQFEEFTKDLNECVKYLKGKKLDKSTKTRFSKKVRKVVAKYFNIKLSETSDIILEHTDTDLVVKYPFNGDYLTLMRFEIKEQSN